MYVFVNNKKIKLICFNLQVRFVDLILKFQMSLRFKLNGLNNTKRGREGHQ